MGGIVGVGRSRQMMVTPFDLLTGKYAGKTGTGTGPYKTSKPKYLLGGGRKLGSSSFGFGVKVLNINATTHCVEK